MPVTPFPCVWLLANPYTGLNRKEVVFKYTASSSSLKPQTELEGCVTWRENKISSVSIDTVHSVFIFMVIVDLTSSCSLHPGWTGDSSYSLDRVRNLQAGHNGCLCTV